jgi:hypothetical protein
MVVNCVTFSGAFVGTTPIQRQAITIEKVEDRNFMRRPLNQSGTKDAEQLECGGSETAFVFYSGAWAGKPFNRSALRMSRDSSFVDSLRQSRPTNYQLRVADHYLLLRLDLVGPEELPCSYGVDCYRQSKQRDFGHRYFRRPIACQEKEHPWKQNHGVTIGELPTPWISM